MTERYRNYKKIFNLKKLRLKLFFYILKYKFLRNKKINYTKEQHERIIKNLAIIKQNNKGRILPKFLPAIYLDTSFLIYYWLVEDFETREPGLEENKIPYYSIIKKLLRTEEKFERTIKIRKKILMGENKKTPVLSPLALLELMEWYTEARFRNIAFSATEYDLIKNKGKKDIGNYLKRLFELRKKEIKENKKTKNYKKTELECLHAELWPHIHFGSNPSLEGLSQVDIENFNFSIEETWDLPSLLAFCQIGLADIMHIMLAKHLGCEYIGSLDSDFRLIKDFVKEELNINILCNLDEILKEI